MDYAGLRDEELMDRLVERDMSAFEALYDRYADLVYSVSLRVVGEAHVAQDVTQDVFLRVWRAPVLHFHPGGQRRQVVRQLPLQELTDLGAAKSQRAQVVEQTDGAGLVHRMSRVLPRSRGGR